MPPLARRPSASAARRCPAARRPCRRAISRRATSSATFIDAAASSVCKRFDAARSIPPAASRAPTLTSRRDHARRIAFSSSRKFLSRSTSARSVARKSRAVRSTSGTSASIRSGLLAIISPKYSDAPHSRATEAIRSSVSSTRASDFSTAARTRATYRRARCSFRTRGCDSPARARGSPSSSETT